MNGNVYLIPSFLHEQPRQDMPAAVLAAVAQCQVLFVENLRSARRYLKQLNREIIIDDYEWFAIGKAEAEVLQSFTERLKLGKTIGIISEAGCPGVADPGQLLVAKAQELGARVLPLVGPSSILLALMASGMNGQQFSFLGYLPIDKLEREKAVREQEAVSKRQNSTRIFIETPYRNQQLLETLLKICHPATRICIAADITGPEEFIKTMTVQQWKQQQPSLHKRPVIFLLKA
ncbi:SAM-dependent methyltransferase [Niabella terrae]